MMAQLTVLIPCKNERLNIRPCIESVRSIADEILIADSGSTDDTLDIVRKIGGCRIIERE
jgi:glycosyltransferase involved in cell wall biosynthesis